MPFEGKIIYPQGSGNYAVLVSVYIDVADLSVPIHVRLYARGKIIIGKLIQDQDVAAYLDITVNPK